MPALVWFRNDLRLHDHPAVAAAAAGDGMIGCFLLADRQWRDHDWAPCKVAFILAQLRTLQADCAKRGIPVLVRRAARFDDAANQLLALCRDTGAQRVHALGEYALDEDRRDRAVAAALAKHGIAFQLHHGQCILPPGSVRTGKGGPYTVFSPFRRRWLATLDAHPPTPLPPPRRQKPPSLGPEPIPDRLPAYGHLPACAWMIGEQRLRRSLERAVAGRLCDYRDLRDRPAVDGTSRLSAALASGAIAAAHCLRAAAAANAGHCTGGSLGTWIDELIWRDFYRHVMAAFPRICRHRPFRLATEDILWDHREDLEEAWQSGRTGIPIIDAGMRQLLATGWMHNRLRMLTAAFFSKHCLLDWRRGERFFMRHLIDGDLASNNGGWQWSASTGTDAAPYFRVFNPITQSRRHDPDGTYLRHWLPELAGLDNHAIHEPTAEQRTACGYPSAVLDLATARQRAIAVFRQAAQAPARTAVKATPRRR